MTNNTIFTAKSSFGDGLLMDFAPDNTQATCLTHALNATLLTMNGNELSLQNDMGNGRVETAYLPEGYVPVGTCEFGDIIYIVSYNPITNKSQIGCFPSPERNISSKELSGIETTFDLEEFTRATGFGFRETISNSVKKVIYDNSLNPGDKFIVHSGNIANNMSRISDYGNKSHIVGAFPKQFKINVVAIEDSGKINYLNSDLKWYDDFFINTKTSSETGKPDIDTYRDILNSGYSVFQSKVSGKLAILIELERIQTFNSTYEVLKSKETANTKEVTQTSDSTDQETPTVNYQSYDIYINFNWKTNNLDVNPKSIVIYDFKWVSNSGDNNKGGQYYVNGEKKGKADPPKFTKIDETGKIQQYIELEIKGQANTNSYADFLGSNYQKESDKYKGHTKITQQVENGIPTEGKYYLDLHHIVDGIYYNNKGESAPPIEVTDCIVNNYFKSSITKKGFTIDIPDTYGNNKIDKRDLILSFKVAPMMEYGVLSDLVQTHYIDFSKIGSGEINLEGYKYYIGENLCTLQIDSSIYPEDNKGVAEIEVQFYDNQGLCAKYFINNLVSYSGIITEYIPLNGNSSNYKLSKQDGKKLIPHAGQMFTDKEKPENVDTTLSYVYLNTNADNLKPVEVTYDEEKKIFYKVDDPDKQEVIINSTSPIFYNDAGILYSNMLYAVKIIYKYTSRNVLGEYNTDGTKWDNFEWRWLWTNTMFNQYYYNVKDFKDNQFELTLDVGAQYYANFKSQKVYNYENVPKKSDNLYEGLGLNLEYINNGKINYSVNLGLQEAYNSFSLNKESVDNTTIDIYEGSDYIQFDNENIVSNNNYSNLEYLNQSKDNKIIDGINKKYQYIIDKDEDNSNIKNPWDNSEAYKNYNPIFKLNIPNSKTDTSKQITYVGNDTQEHISNTYIQGEFKNLTKDQSLSINLVNPSLYIKQYISKESNQQELVNLLQKGYQDYGLELDNNKFKFSYVYSIWANDSGSHGNDKCRYLVQWDQSKQLNNIINSVGDLELTPKLTIPETYELAINSYIWQIRRSQGREWHSVWKSQYNYFLRSKTDSKDDTDVNGTYSGFDLPNGFFVNLVGLCKNETYISKGNTTYRSSRLCDLFEDGMGRKGVFAQLAYNYNGDIHLLNDYYMILDTNFAGAVTSTLQDNLQTLANMWAGWLSSTYVLSDSTTVLSTELIDTIYNKKQTNFIKDIVFKSNLTNNNSSLLLNGYYYDKYLNGLRAQINNNSEEPNITVKFNNITKNIPVIIQLNSLMPEYKYNNSSIKIKSFCNQSYDNVNITNVSSNNLYYISDNNLIPLNNNQKVYYVNTYKPEIEIKKDTQFSTFTIPKVFRYQDQVLTPIYTNPTALRTYAQCFYGGGKGGSIKDLLSAETIISELNHV